MHPPFHVVGQVQQADFHFGAFEADGADDVPVHHGLGSENVLDPRPHGGLFSVAGLLVLRQWRGAGTLLMGLALQAPLRQIGFPFGGAVGTVGIHRALAGFGGARLGIQEFVEDLAVMDVRGCDRVMLDQFGGRIGVDVVLVAVVGFVVFLGPAGVRFFLPALGGLPGVIPSGGNLTRFDRGVLRAVIALARGFDKACPEPVEGVASIMCPDLAT